MENNPKQFHQIDLNNAEKPAIPNHFPNEMAKSARRPPLALTQMLNSAYVKWAKFVVGHRNAIMAICTVLSTLGGIKIMNTPFVNDLNGFTPYGARALAESAIRDQFFNANGTQRGGGGSSFGVFLLIMPKQPGANMLEAKMLEEVMKVDDLLNWNITLESHHPNKSSMAYVEFCRHFCNINEPVRLFLQGLRLQKDFGNEEEKPQISLNYPTINVLGHKLNIQPYFHGIKFAEKATKNASNLASVEMVALIYKGERENGLGLSEAEVKEYELKVAKFFENQFQSDLVRVLSISTSYVEAEFVRASLSMLPFLGIGFGVMLLCTSLSIPLSAAYFQQATVHKISLALIACICPFMATGTALGLLFLLGVRFSPILCATPFLVLAIGVDDAYLMTHAWNRLARKCQFLVSVPSKEREAEEKEDVQIVADLLAMVLTETGPAVLISACANICADAIGAFIGSPEITLLCVGNATALAFDFLFQCTYFIAVMATVGLVERKEARKKWKTDKVGDVQTGMAPAAGLEHGKMTQPGWQQHFHDLAKAWTTRFVDFYVSALSNWAICFGVLLTSLLFIGFSILQITKFEVEMNTKQLYASDSPLLEIDGIRETRISPFYTQATVFVNNPGNLSDPTRLSKIDEFVNEFELLPQSWGPSSSMDFLRDFREYLAKEKAESEEENGGQIAKLLNSRTKNSSKASSGLDCAKLEEFLEEPENAHWKGFLRLGRKEEANATECVESFYFTTAFKDPKLVKWSERVEMLKKWRKIVDEHREDLGASVYHEEGIYLDLMDNMPTDTWQSAVATLACMGIICLAMMRDVRTVLATTTVIAAIIVETLGLLSFSGVALNQLLMGSLVICIGFSVDLPAHFSYHYLTSGEEAPSSKLKATIRSVGLPSVQASLSTGLCVLSHYWVKLYIAQIFVRIMCLTLLLCLLNTLVVLPALLGLIGLAGKHFK